MMKYKGYLGVAQPRPDARVFRGSVVNIADTITFQGESYEDLVARVPRGRWLITWSVARRAREQPDSRSSDASASRDARDASDAAITP
jgi:hypothetical protein